MSDRVFETNGDIVVRTARTSDAELIVNYYEANRTFLEPWEPERTSGFYSIFEWSKRLIKLHELHSLGLGFYLVILNHEQSEMIGTISFSQVNRFPMFACNVGYSLAQSVQGKGIMTEALSLACQHMFKKENMHRIVAAYMPRNHRSEAVLHRVGFENEGVAKDYLLINGKWEDHNLTALVNHDWRLAV